jgi:hypothetical protein
MLQLEPKIRVDPFEVGSWCELNDVLGYCLPCDGRSFPKQGSYGGPMIRMETPLRGRGPRSSRIRLVLHDPVSHEGFEVGLTRLEG